MTSRKVLLHTGLLLVGLLLAFTIFRNLASEFAPYLWDKTSCSIRKAEIVNPEQQPLHYRFSVSYDYEVNGQRFTSSRWRRTSVEPYDSYSGLTDRVGKYVIDSTSHAYVNPDDPSQAVLQRENPLRLLLLLIPMLAILPAARVLFFRGRPVIRVRFALQLVALAVVAFGFFLFWIFFAHAFFDWIRSKSWKETTGTVLSSYLYTDQTSATGSSSTRRPGHRLRVLFSYNHEGKELRADRYDFIRWGTGGSTLVSILQKYPEGTRVACYMNPDKPYEAVINRSFSFRYLMGLLPLLMCAGGWVLFLVARKM